MPSPTTTPNTAHVEVHCRKFDNLGSLSNVSDRATRRQLTIAKTASQSSIQKLLTRKARTYTRRSMHITASDALTIPIVKVASLEYAILS